MRVLFIRWILFSVSALLFITHCSSPTKSNESTKVIISDVWFSDPVDNDGDDFVSYARLNFDLDTNKDNIDVTVKLGVRFYDPADTATYYVYFTSAAITIMGNDNPSDARYIDIGGSNLELPAGFFDFLLQVFPASNPDANPVAEASHEDFPDMRGFAFEPQSDDQLPIMNLSTSSLNFGSGDTELSFTIKNIGGSILDWEITSDRDWLSVSETFGTTEEETDQVYVYADRTGLSTGSYFGTLTIEPNFGSVETIAVQMEVAAAAFQFTFTNQVFTDISMEVSGQVNRTIQPGGSHTYYYTSNPGSVTLYAQTCGEPTPGVTAGLPMVWSATYTTTGVSTMTRNLIIDQNYVYIYLQNTGDHNLHHFYVNYGASDQRYDDIYLPNDSVTKGIGYYNAHSGMEVRAWWYLENTYVYWIEGTHFTLPNTINQSVFLWNNTKSIPEEIPGGIFAAGGDAATPLFSGISQKTERLDPQNLTIGRAWQPEDRIPEIVTRVPETTITEHLTDAEENHDLGFAGTSGPRLVIKLVPQESSTDREKIKLYLKTDTMKR